MDWIPFAWFAAALIPLVLLERWIHRHMQGLAFLAVGNAEIAIWLYALPLLPGIVLHEVSHALAGFLVGAKVGRISIFPERAGGRVQLGFVPVKTTNQAQTAVIGLAPLLTGCMALVLIGYLGLNAGPLVAALAAGDWGAVRGGLGQAVQASDAWVWAYLAFSISNTMTPSRSDMRAWPIILVFLLGTAGVSFLLWGFALIDGLSSILRWLAVATTLTLLIDIPFALFILGAEEGLARLKGVRVEYQ